MHTALKFFDFSAKGNFGPMEKTDIKFSGPGEGLESKAASEFLKIMGATMDLKPEQVRAALDRFQNIHTEGEPVPGLAPFIEPAGEEGNPNDLLALLMGRKPETKASPESEHEDEADDNDDDHCEGCLVMAEAGQVEMKAKEVPALSPDQSIRADVTAGIDKSTAVKPDPVLDSPGMKKGWDGDIRKTEVVKPAVPAPETFGQDVAAQTRARGLETPRPVHVSPREAVVTESVKPATVSVDSQVPAADKADPAPKTAPAAEARPQANAVDNSTTLQASRSESAAAAAFVAANPKPSGTDRPISAAPKKATTPTAPLTTTGPATVTEESKPVMGEALKVEADAPKSAQNGFIEEAENGTPENKAGEGETVQRTPAGRQGFQSVISRIESHAGRTAEADATDKSMPEPSKEMKNDIMRQIVQRMTLRTQGDQSRMQIHLKPEFLGNVHMQITTENQQVAVRMTAESVVVKEMIEQHLSFLKSELQQHGLEIDKFDVQVGGDREGWKNSQDPSGFRQALKEGQQGRRGRRRKAPREEPQPHGTEKVDSGQKRQTSEIDYFA